MSRGVPSGPVSVIRPLSSSSRRLSGGRHALPAPTDQHQQHFRLADRPLDDFAEGQPGWHGRAFKKGEEMDRALAELERWHRDRGGQFLLVTQNIDTLHEQGSTIVMVTHDPHAAAFALCHRVYGGERYRRLALMIRRAIGLLMVQDNRFLRRLDSRR